MSATLISATPILFTGLAAAAAFRMQLFNIGGGGPALPRRRRRIVDRAPARRSRRDVDAALRRRDVHRRRCPRGAAGRSIPGVLRAFAHTNEIITSLMLNYVAGLLLTYLIFDSSSYWRDTSTLAGPLVPAGEADARGVPTGRRSARPVVVPLGFLVGLAVALALWVLYSRMRFGFEVERHRRLAARGAVRGHADATEDPRR